MIKEAQLTNLDLPRLSDESQNSYFLLPYFENIATLIIVAECNSIRSAASIYKCTEGAVSKRIKKLEVILGKILLERTNKGVSLTIDGQMVVDTFKPLLNNYIDLSKTFLTSKPSAENNDNYDDSPENTFFLPIPFPNSSVMWELVSEPIIDNTLIFDFSPEGVFPLTVDFISMVYKFDVPRSLLQYSFLDVDLSFLSGDFGQVNLEFHGEDAFNNMNIYSTPAELKRESSGEFRKVYTIKLHEKNIEESLKRLREICFVVPLPVIVKAKIKRGSFRINKIIPH